MKIKALLTRKVWDEKLLNPLGISLLLIASILIVSMVFSFGIISGLLFIVGLVALPVVYGVMAYPKFGIAVLLVMAFFLFFILRFGIDFPLGTMMDALEWLLIVGVVLSYRIAPNPGIFKNPVAILVMLWVAYTLVQVVNPWAESRMAWLYTVRTVGAVTLMYFVFMYRIDTIAYLRLLIRLWIALAFCAAVYGYKQEYIGFAESEFQRLISDPLLINLLYIDGHWRKYSIFADPVTFAYNMVMVFFICLSLFRLRKSFSFNLLLAGVGFAAVSAMLFTGTRGAYVLIPAGLMLYFILRFDKRIMVLGVVAAVGMFILINIPTGNPTLYRFQSAFKPNDDASFNVRAQNQKKIQPYIWSHPVGGGLGATGVWGVRFAPGSFLASFPPDSGYVRIAVELGWIGLLLFSVLLFFALKTGIDNYFLIRNPELKAYCLAMTLVLFVLGVGSYPQEAIVQFPSNILFYLAIAIIQCSARLDLPVDQR
ncbi:MAG: O-antigen ligase family protein [Bacteroidetes bacterium]|nr:O-antigen ligase family protein [Bacteroidota bacterium]